MTTLSPVTRIEGHLGVDLETDNGRVVSARVMGEMFRGFEVILRGRDPLDAQRITQSICGVCPIEHGTASVFAQDAVYGVEPPSNGRLLRNLIQAGNFLASHLTHFYLLSGPDFVNAAALADYTGSDPALLQLRAFVARQRDAATSGQSGIVNPAGPLLPQFGTTRLCPDAALNERLLSHYGECIGLQTTGIKAIAHKMVAVFAGKVPHAATLIPGGVTEQVTALKIEQFRVFLAQIGAFIDRAYWSDLLAVAAAFPEYFDLGHGPGTFLAFGAFPEGKGGARFFPAGVYRGGTLKPLDVDAITEDVKYSWFRSKSGAQPKAGETTPDPDKAGAYSWLKAPRYKGEVVEVGALARMLVAYHTGTAGVRESVDAVLSATGKTLPALNSVLGRHVSRAIESKLLVARCQQWLDQLEPGQPTFVNYRVPATGSGVGLTEAARGALGHWIQIEGGKIANYQCVVPTTWNCSPRDDRDQPGAMEQALVGTPNLAPDAPLEAMRVVRSFDPCLACAVH